MTYKEAMKECRRVGTSHATEDALRAMYANLISEHHVYNNPERFYLELRGFDTDDQIADRSRELLRDNTKALTILLQCERCPEPYQGTVKTRFNRERLCAGCIANYQRDNPDSKTKRRRTMWYFYECGICDCLHPAKFEGDCRDDANRFTSDQLDAEYGDENWIAVPMDEADQWPRYTVKVA